jgi:hypothetical protein
MPDEGAPRGHVAEPGPAEPAAAEPGAAGPAAAEPVTAETEPAAPDSPEPDRSMGVPEQAPGRSTGPSANSLLTDLFAAWTRLDGPAQLMAAGSLAAMALILLGLPFGVWLSAQFAGLVLLASAITATTAWFGDEPIVEAMPVPMRLIEHGGAVVAAVLAVLKLVEAMIDLNEIDGVRGFVRLGFAVALVVATLAVVVALDRRGTDLRADVLRGDQGTRRATLGWALVLLGWLVNLSVSFWTMGQAALPVASMTLAALFIVEATRIESPVPLAWVGVTVAAFGALLLLGQWGDLLALGRLRYALGPADFLGILSCTAGTALVISGGIETGRLRWALRHPPTEKPG